MKKLILLFLLLWLASLTHALALEPPDRETRSPILFHDPTCHIQPFPVSEKSDDRSTKKEYEELEKELQSLLDEFKKLEKEARDKIRRDVLPVIKREIEKLREWLKEFELEEKEPGENKDRSREYQMT